ncbi:hypothetical protein VNO80_18378 [Phaseolus coccineus]|uniref:Uncharacterized protein n=1 Tax=Phaseolus coccineus TaxID=3886 RepID=A0AAN9MEK1_PHACN
MAGYSLNWFCFVLCDDMYLIEPVMRNSDGDLVATKDLEDCVCFHLESRLMELVGSVQKNPVLILCNSLKHQFQEFTKQHADDSRGYSGSTFQKVIPPLLILAVQD